MVVPVNWRKSMKNKSKLKKIKSNKNRPVRNTNIPEGWFIMSKNEITVADLKSAFGENQNIEVWSDAGIMEIVIGEKASIDIETIDTVFGDEYSDNFIEENQIKSVFYLTFHKEKYDLAKPYLNKISSFVEGFICGDTDDFTPVI